MKTLIIILAFFALMLIGCVGVDRTPVTPAAPHNPITFSTRSFGFVVRNVDGSVDTLGSGNHSKSDSIWIGGNIVHDSTRILNPATLYYVRPLAEITFFLCPFDLARPMYASAHVTVQNKPTCVVGLASLSTGLRGNLFSVSMDPDSLLQAYNIPGVLYKLRFVHDTSYATGFQEGSFTNWIPRRSSEGIVIKAPCQIIGLARAADGWFDQGDSTIKVIITTLSNTPVCTTRIVWSIQYPDTSHHWFPGGGVDSAGHVMSADSLHRLGYIGVRIG